MENNSASFEDLLNENEAKKITHLTPGQKITATVAGISGESIFLDTGGKSEGILNASEFIDEEGNVTVSVGDDIEVYFLQQKRSEQLFTTKIGTGSSIAHLEEAWRSGIPVEGVVKTEIKGGFEITLGNNVKAFCPYSQMGLRRVENAAEEYLEQRIQFRISRLEEGGRNIVVSARAILEEEREQQKEALKETLAEGETVEGEISSLRDFGAFVDLGGIDGLIPISEIGWSRVDKIEDHFSVGQKVNVVIKSLDWEKDRISLSYKDTLADPWENLLESFPEGSSQTGKVVRLTQFGAFVTLTEGIDGLIHISKLGGGRKINHPREVLETGQDVDVIIEGIDQEKKRISLAPSDYKAPEDEEKTERKEYTNFVSQKNKEKKSDSMGSLGELLQAKFNEKKK
jgi:small subunit ribosomal protein S1